MKKIILFSVLIAAVLIGCDCPHHIHVFSRGEKKRFSDIHETLAYIREIKSLFPSDTVKVFIDLEWHDVSIIKQNFRSAHFQGENFHLEERRDYDDVIRYIVNQPTLSEARLCKKVIGEFHF